MGNNRILVVDDEKDLLELLDARLTNEGYLIFKCSTGEDVVNRVEEVAPDLILLDIMLPDINGFAVKELLNKSVSTANIPVIFLTAKNGTHDKIRGLKLGVDDYVTKPFNPDELLARVSSVLHRRDYYERIAMTDELTGLYNFNFFKKHIPLFFSMAKRYKKVFSLGIIDIDNFKEINDQFGHAAGDYILQEFSAAAKDTLRDADTITRYGGDEFAILMPETDQEQANKTIERLKAKINGMDFYYKNKDKKLRFSFSAGVATYNDDIENEGELFELADSRLYEHKNQK